MAEKQMTSLEERLSKLEELTVKLEDGHLSIDDAIALYSQGMELAVSCKKSLDELSQKISIARRNAQQSISVEDFSGQQKDDSLRGDTLQIDKTLPF